MSAVDTDPRIQNAVEAGIHHLAGLTRRDPDAQARVDRARTDIAFFESYYLPHYFSHPAGKFHGELDPFLRAPGHCAIEAPRGHGKSTKTSLSSMLHDALYKEGRYLVFISETATKAAAFIGFIQHELETNERIRADFGDMRSGEWREDRFVLANDVCIQSFGEGQKLRGARYKEFRPDLIVIDDPESLATTQSAAVRRKRQDWFEKEVLGALGRDGKCVLIGTCVHYACLLRHAVAECAFRSKRFQAIIKWPKRMDLWQAWENLLRETQDREAARAWYLKRKRYMDEGAEVLWPEYWTLYLLMLRRFEMGSVAFACEFQNEAIDPNAQRFREKWIRYYTPEEISDLALSIFIACDPSLGRRDQADFSAILVGGVVRPQTLYILESIIDRMSPGDLINTLFRLSQKWRPLKLGMETNAFQVLLADRLKEKTAEHRMFLPVEEMQNYSDKVLRISSISPLVENGIIRFRKEDAKLIEQLVFFPKADHDDGPDALEMLVRLARGGGPVEFKRAGSTRIGAGVSDFCGDRDLKGFE